MMRRVSLRLCLNQLCWSALGFGPGYSNSAFQALECAIREGGVSRRPRIITRACHEGRNGITFYV